MEMTFKRSLLGLAVAAAAMSGSANAAIDLHGEAVQMYGQAAGAVFIQAQDQANDTAFAEIESRIGFKGRVAFDAISPDFIWQIESGNTNNVPWADGKFGQRDTFLGFDFDGVGSFKFGRQLVAAYNYVDWPHSNPGLGNVFDANNDLGVTFEDRANNVFRFDSANFGGFNFQATLSGMGSDTDAMVASIAASYSTDMFSVHAGYYDQGRYKTDVAATDPSWVFDKDNAGCDKGNEDACWETKPGTPKGTKDAGDNSYSIVGGSMFLGDVTLTAAWKHMENGLTNIDQDAYSATAQYVIDGAWVLKAGYAATTDTEGEDDGDRAITGRLGYLLPSAYLYLDVRNYDMNGADESKDGTNILLGTEYYF
ncbi:porin [Enterovibrio paralichthyis]|uniref:porin n=1 Tax=Enterovibrio paralichthyis TaxID=2853805 RepID=UPI001C44D585|nr:porin [Enterovibrio paralichthyis]MBV7298513.1 porin [Enterovibrio paralichthyis]